MAPSYPFILDVKPLMVWIFVRQIVLEDKHSEFLFSESAVLAFLAPIAVRTTVCYPL